MIILPAHAGLADSIGSNVFMNLLTTPYDGPFNTLKHRYSFGMLRGTNLFSEQFCTFSLI